jgi:hypothetical protein
MKLPGKGWTKVRQTAGIAEESSELWKNFWGWASCVVFIYSTTIGLGKLLLHEYSISCSCFLVATLSLIILYRHFKSSENFLYKKDKTERIKEYL